MRRKNLGLKVAALAVTGTIAVSPMTVRAEEGTASTAVSAPASAAAVGTASGTGTTAASGAASTTVAAAASGTTAAAPAAGTTASTPAASTTTVTATAAAPAAGATATTSATTATTTATATPAAPVTVSEPAADPATTVPNNVDTNASDDNMQGTKITARGINFEITPDDVKDKTELSAKSNEFNGTVYANKESGDLVMKGDLSIKEEQSAGNYDSTENAAHDVEDGKTYSLKADLDVSAVSNAIRA